MCVICFSKQLRRCQKIKCCNKIREIPELFYTKQLTCNTQEIVKIFPSEKLQKLNCNFAIHLSELPIFPNLISLHCRGTFLTEIPFLLNLRNLNCANTKITEIPFLPNLEKLLCNKCPNLTKITSLPLLKSLDCSQTNITELPNFPELKNLVCASCPKLENLPFFPNLKKINCECTLIKEIHPFEKLEWLKCNGCLLLKSIPRINIKYLYCSACPLLTEILSETEFLNCSYCSQLKTIRSLEHRINNISFYNCRMVIYNKPFLGYKTINGTHWVSFDVKFDESVKKLIKLQKFAKKYVRYSIIKRYIKSREFAEWFYDPKNFGGYKVKQRLEKMLLKTQKMKDKI